MRIPTLLRISDWHPDTPDSAIREGEQSGRLWLFRVDDREKIKAAMEEDLGEAGLYSLSDYFELAFDLSMDEKVQRLDCAFWRNCDGHAVLGTSSGDDVTAFCVLLWFRGNVFQHTVARVLAERMPRMPWDAGTPVAPTVEAIKAAVEQASIPCTIEEARDVGDATGFVR